MLTTAIATAVTLTVTPIMTSNAALDTQADRLPSWTKESVTFPPSLKISKVISLAGQRPSYYLSKTEQGALKRALLRSVKIIEPRFA